MCDYGKNRSTKRQTKLKTLEQKRTQKVNICITKTEVTRRRNYRNERIAIDK